MENIEHFGDGLGRAPGAGEQAQLPGRDGMSPEVPRGADAKAALYVLEAVRTKGMSVETNPRVVEALVNSGYLISMPIKLFREYLGKAQEGPGALAIANSAQKELDASKKEIGKLEHRLGSAWYYFTSLDWLGSGVSKKEEARLVDLKKEVKELKSTLEDAREKVATSTEYQGAIASFREYGDHALKLTPLGERLYRELSARKSLLNEISLEDFEKGMANVREIVEGRIGRLTKAMGLLGTAGMSTLSDQTIDLALALSQKKGDVKLIIKQATTVDDALTAYGLTEAQRLHLVGVIATGDASKEAVKKTLQLAGEFKEHGSKISTAYEAIYVAAQVGNGDSPNSEKVETFNKVVTSLERIGFKQEWGLTKHIASRLSSHPDVDEACSEFKDTIEVLKKGRGNDLTNVAIAALSLIKLAGSTERRFERFETMRRLLGEYGLSTGQKADSPMIGALASLPGHPAATIELLSQARAALEKVLPHKKATSARAMVILTGALGDLIALEAEAVTEVGAETETSTGMRVGRSSRDDSFSTTGATSASAYGSDSFYPYYPVFFDGGGGAHLNESSITPHGVGQHDAGGMLDGGHHGGLDFSAPDSSGALCGSTSSHGEGGASSSCGSSGSSSPSSCGSSSCGSSGGSSSCGSSSCGSSCGGGGCGGGGCGGS